MICLTLISGQDTKTKAQKLFVEAEELFNKNTPEARAEAAPKYAEALKLWQEAGKCKRKAENYSEAVAANDCAETVETTDRLRL